MRTRFIQFTSLAAMLVAASSIAHADLKIGVAAEPYPPFSSKDASGKWVGWEIDLISALCTEMKEKCEIVDVAWDGIIPALTAKKIDVIVSSMSITDKRKEVISFSAPYYVSAPAVAGVKDGDKNVSAEHLSGKTIGVQVSTTHAAYVEKYFGKTSTMKTYQTQDEANQDLAAGRIDYVVQDGIATTGLSAVRTGQLLRDEVNLAKRCGYPRHWRRHGHPQGRLGAR